MLNISRKEWNEASREILDEETGLTRADLLEYQYGDGINIID